MVFPVILRIKVINMIDEAIGTILQILVFTSIPFLVFIIRKRSTKGFLKYIGLKKSTKKANFLAILASLIFAGGFHMD